MIQKKLQLTKDLSSVIQTATAMTPPLCLHKGYKYNIYLISLFLKYNVLHNNTHSRYIYIILI